MQFIESVEMTMKIFLFTQYEDEFPDLYLFKTFRAQHIASRKYFSNRWQISKLKIKTIFFLFLSQEFYRWQSGVKPWRPPLTWACRGGCYVNAYHLLSWKCQPMKWIMKRHWFYLTQMPLWVHTYTRFITFYPSGGDICARKLDLGHWWVTHKKRERERERVWASSF